MLEGKLKPEYRFNKIVIFSGCEFVKTDWRPIPAGMESAATRPEYFLELRIPPMEVAEPVKVGRPKVVKEVVEKVVVPVPVEVPVATTEPEPALPSPKESVPKERFKRGGPK